MLKTIQVAADRAHDDVRNSAWIEVAPENQNQILPKCSNMHESGRKYRPCGRMLLRTAASTYLIEFFIDIGGIGTLHALKKYFTPMRVLICREFDFELTLTLDNVGQIKIGNEYPERCPIPT